MQRHYVMVSLNRFRVFVQRAGCGFRFGWKEEQRGAVLTLLSSLFSQYYEMSYGLNIEMHKQVGNCFCISTRRNWFKQTVAIKFHAIFFYWKVLIWQFYGHYLLAAGPRLYYLIEIYIESNFKFKSKAVQIQMWAARSFLCWILEAFNCFLSIINVCLQYWSFRNKLFLIYFWFHIQREISSCFLHVELNLIVQQTVTKAKRNALISLGIYWYSLTVIFLVLNRVNEFYTLGVCNKKELPCQDIRPNPRDMLWVILTEYIFFRRLQKVSICI